MCGFVGICGVGPGICGGVSPVDLETRIPGNLGPETWEPNTPEARIPWSPTSQIPGIRVAIGKRVTTALSLTVCSAHVLYSADILCSVDILCPVHALLSVHTLDIHVTTRVPTPSGTYGDRSLQSIALVVCPWMQ